MIMDEATALEKQGLMELCLESCSGVICKMDSGFHIWYTTHWHVSCPYIQDPVRYKRSYHIYYRIVIVFY
jgi:hypothetical protein